MTVRRQRETQRNPFSFFTVTGREVVVLDLGHSKLTLHTGTIDVNGNAVESIEIVKDDESNFEVIQNNPPQTVRIIVRASQIERRRL